MKGDWNGLQAWESLVSQQQEKERDSVVESVGLYLFTQHEFVKSLRVPNRVRRRESLRCLQQRPRTQTARSPTAGATTCA